MKNLSNSPRYQAAQTYTNSERLPAGAYKLQILAVRYENNESKGYSDVIVLSFDIAEGDYNGFYRKQYDNNQQEDKKWKGNYRLYVPKDDGSEQDEWTMRRFKTVMAAFEDSNPGYIWDWDENKLKGKYIGGVFNDKEYDFNGRQGFFTNCHHLCSVEALATEKIPEPTYLNGNKKTEEPQSIGNGFIDVPEGIDEDLPFR